MKIKKIISMIMIFVMVLLLPCSFTQANDFVEATSINYYEETAFTDAEGIVAESDEQIFKYVYGRLSQGEYTLGIRGSDQMDLDKASKTLEKALDLYDEYIYATSVTYIRWLISGYDDEFWIYELDYPDTKGKEVSQKADKKANDILKKIIKKGMTDKQKCSAIYDYLTKNCKYDYSSSNYYQSTAYGALANKKATCAGYSNAFNLLARKAGVTSIMVSGGGHAWNMVKIDGKFYYIDTTWGASANKNYFLVTASQLKKDHTWNESYYKNFYNKYSKYTAYSKLSESHFGKNYAPSLKKVKTTSKLTVNKGKSKTIKITLPEDLTKVSKYTGKDGQVKISYKSSNKKIATVNSKGKVTGKKKGTVNITVTVKLQDGTKKSFKSKVTVK